MHEYWQIIQRLFNTPLYLHPDKAAAILQGIGPRLHVDLTALPEPAAPEANRFAGKWQRDTRPYGLSQLSGGVSIISIVGSLVNRGAWVGASSGLVSYEGIAAQLLDATNDAEVRAILLDMDSYGGEASGMTSIADAVHAAAKIKPVLAVANDSICSAAYAIASQATEIWCSPSSFVGSVGTIVVHIDQTAAMERDGRKATIIRSGAKKAIGSGIEPLSDEAKDHLTDVVMTYNALLLKTVERGRGNKFTASHGEKAEGAVFIGAKAISEGLADKIGSFEDALRYLSTGGVAVGARKRSGAMMMTDQVSTQAAAPAAPSFSQEDVNKAAASAVAGERSRIKAILESPEAEGRTKLAMHIALNSSQSVEEAKGFLGVAALEASGPAVPSLDARMANENVAPVNKGGTVQPKAQGKYGEAADWGKLHAVKS